MKLYIGIFCTLGSCSLLVAGEGNLLNKILLVTTCYVIYVRFYMLYIRALTFMIECCIQHSVNHYVSIPTNRRSKMCVDRLV